MVHLVQLFSRDFQSSKALEKMLRCLQACPRDFQSNVGIRKAESPMPIKTSFALLVFSQMLNFFYNYYHKFFSFSILPFIVRKLTLPSLKSAKSLISFNKKEKRNPKTLYKKKDLSNNFYAKIALQFFFTKPNFHFPKAL